MVKLFGLVGKKLGHSFSRVYFLEKFKTLHLPHDYLMFEVDRVRDILSFRDMFPNLRGFNITLPYKEEILPLLSELDVTAQAIGAVNTVVWENDGRLIGYNTDLNGFEGSLLSFLNETGVALTALLQTPVLILGTGGSAKAVRYVLTERLGFRQVFLVSRNKSDAYTLLYNELSPQLMAQVRLVVQTTPLGMFPHTAALPDLPYHLLNERHLLFDLIYNPAETEFLLRGKAQGAQTRNGLQMLHLQADRAWEIWNQND